MKVVSVVALALMGSRAHLMPAEQRPKHPKAAPSHSISRKVASTDNLACSINAVDQPVGKILEALSLQTKTNLVLVSPSEAKITLRLDNTPLVDMIRHLCAM